MALIVGVNSWVTLLESNEYFNTWFGLPMTTWATLTDVDKEALLITSYNGINKDSNLDIPADSDSAKVKEAQSIYAWWYYLNGDDSHKRGGLIDQGVTEFKTLDFMEKYGKTAGLPEDVLDLLEDFKKSNGSGFAVIERPGYNACN